MMFNKVDSQTLRLNEENERQARDVRQEETLEEFRVTTAETIRDGLDIVARTREAEVIDIPSPAGPIPVFVYTPEDARRVYLHGEQKEHCLYVLFDLTEGYKFAIILPIT